MVRLSQPGLLLLLLLLLLLRLLPVSGILIKTVRSDGANKEKEEMA